LFIQAAFLSHQSGKQRTLYHSPAEPRPGLEPRADRWDDEGKKRCSMAEKRHPGITMHKLSFGGGFMGLLFAVGSALIFVLGFPTLWYFVALAFALGVGIAVFLRLIGSRRSERNKPLSILSSAEKTASPLRPSREKQQSLLHALPQPFSA